MRIRGPSLLLLRNGGSNPPPSATLIIRVLRSRYAQTKSIAKGNLYRRYCHLATSSVSHFSRFSYPTNRAFHHAELYRRARKVIRV